MKISVASGKGGTGKTSVSVNLALSIGEVQFLDCDVEEPNADLLLHTKPQKTASVYTKIPVINRKLCNFCGDCAKFCKFNALFVSSDRTLVFPELCHSCGGCTEVCPQNAITEANETNPLRQKSRSPALNTLFTLTQFIQLQYILPLPAS